MVMMKTVENENRSGGQNGSLPHAIEAAHTMNKRKLH